MSKQCIFCQESRNYNDADYCSGCGRSFENMGNSSNSRALVASRNRTAITTRRADMTTDYRC